MNARQILSIATLAAIVFSWSAMAHAHPQHGLSHESGAWAGFTHPLLGMDHLLAILAVGLLAGFLGGSAVWGLPTTFIFAMLLSGTLGMMHLWWPPAQPFVQQGIVEQGIAISILVFGASLLVARKTPLLASLTVIAFFAVPHGYAHGTEMPTLAQPVLYGLGLLLSTAALLTLGTLAACWAMRSRSGLAGLRLSGAAIALIGLALLIGA